MAYERDILDEADARRPVRYPEVEVAIGMVVEDRASGFCGDVVRWTAEAVTLRDRRSTCVTSRGSRAGSCSRVGP